jgi:ABC-type transport system involved in cytochrome c biogenesis permease subunit
VVEALFWPALLGYGEAALAYASPRTTRAATWGVRLGWLAQTALLAVQAADADGFPWSTWAGSLNLFVWLVVSAYLIWGCRPRYRLLGLAVMPLAVALFVVAAFAGFTIAAALAAVYLWQERRLKHRAADILRLRLPPLTVLEGLTRRTILVSLPLLTLGLGAGLVRLRHDHHSLDALEAVTLLTWGVYGAFLAMHPVGRRAAYLALGVFALVIVARLVLAGSHFA